MASGTMSSSKVETRSQATLPFGEDHKASTSLTNNGDMITKNPTPENVLTPTEDPGAAVVPFTAHQSGATSTGVVHSVLETS
jgi:hypothetical protein